MQGVPHQTEGQHPGHPGEFQFVEPDELAVGQSDINEPTIIKPSVEAKTRIDKSVTLGVVLESIEEVERFQVRISYSDGRKVRGDWTRGIHPYPYENALNGEVMVANWKGTRFLKQYPEFDEQEYQVDVIDGEGYNCDGRRKLKTVRESYRR